MKITLLLSAFLGFYSLQAQTTIYSQLPRTNASSVSTLLANGNYLASADDFTIPNKSTIKKIKIFGLETDNAIQTLGTGALLYIYTDDGGKPAGVPNLTGTPIAAIDLAKGVPGYSLIKTGQSEYTYEIDVSAAQANPLVLEANTVYWLVFMAKMNSTLIGTRFSWYTGQIKGNPAKVVSKGNIYQVGTVWKNASQLPNTTSVSNGLAFSIEGDNEILGVSELFNSTKENAIYPNPASDILTIRSKEKIKTAVIFDISGRKMNVNLNDNKIDVKSLSAGNYILNIETKEGKTSEKFIKK